MQRAGPQERDARSRPKTAMQRPGLIQCITRSCCYLDYLAGCGRRHSFEVVVQKITVKSEQHLSGLRSIYLRKGSQSRSANDRASLFQPRGSLFRSSESQYVYQGTIHPRLV